MYLRHKNPINWVLAPGQSLLWAGESLGGGPGSWRCLPGDIPGTCLAAAVLSPSLPTVLQTSALPSLWLKLLLLSAVAGQRTMSSQRRQFLPAPSTSERGEPFILAGQGTHIHVDGSPCFGAWSCWREKKDSGGSSACHLLQGCPSQQKARGHLHCPGLGAPGGLSKGIPHLLGWDAKGPILHPPGECGGSGGHFQSQMQKFSGKRH